MGADLIGYQTMMPTKFTKEEKIKLKQHLSSFKTLLKSKDFITRVISNSYSNSRKIPKDPILSELEKFSPTFIHELNNLSCSEEVPDLTEKALAIFPIAEKFIDNPSVDGRDVSERHYTILGRKFNSVFAGEMSWGDDPQGQGYDLLRDLDLIGLLSKIEEITIPHKPISNSRILLARLKTK